jgi:hypothetical protein
MKNNQKIINKQIANFVKEICINSWEMNNAQVKQYCVTIAKQNLLMAGLYKDYLQTAKAYAEVIGLSLDDVKKL